MHDPNFQFFKIENYFKESAHIPAVLIQGVEPSVYPRITVSIPTYKRADTLREAVESVLAQKGNHDFLVAVVDNNPEREDETEIMMRGYKDNPRVLYFKNAENIGMSNNWCRCMEVTRSEWVVLLHDDDVLMPDYLDANEPGLLDNVDAIFQLQVDFMDGKEKPVVHNPAEGREMIKITLLDGFLFPATSSAAPILRRQTVMDLGGFSKQTFAPDVFWQKMAYYSNIYRLNTRHVYYRVGINESTKTSAQDRMCIMNHYFRLQSWPLMGIPKWLCKEAILFSDIQFEWGFRKVWNDAFRYSQMPKYTKWEYYKSKFFYYSIYFWVRARRKLFRKRIKLS